MRSPQPGLNTVPPSREIERGFDNRNRFGPLRNSACKLTLRMDLGKLFGKGTWASNTPDGGTTPTETGPEVHRWSKRYQPISGPKSRKAPPPPTESVTTSPGTPVNSTAKV